jgi:hypothetical protein
MQSGSIDPHIPGAEWSASRTQAVALFPGLPLSLLPIEQEAGWAPEPVCTPWQRRIPAGSRPARTYLLCCLDFPVVVQIER